MTDDQKLRGQVVILGRRLNALKGAIERQNLADIEFVFDQVSRSLTKLEELVPAVGESRASDPVEEELLQAAEESDTFRFTIENTRPQDKELTLSVDAMELTGDKIKAFIAARVITVWRRTGNAPKFANIDVKVGIE